MFSPNVFIRGITSSMSATDVAAELLNSPPRIGQGSADSLSAAKALCIVTITTREIKSLLIFYSLFLQTNIRNKSQSNSFLPWDLTFIVINASRLGHRLRLGIRRHQKLHPNMMKDLLTNRRLLWRR